MDIAKRSSLSIALLLAILCIVLESFPTQGFNSFSTWNAQQSLIRKVALSNNHINQNVQRPTSDLIKMSSNKINGSFFNKIPEKDDNDNDDGNQNIETSTETDQFEEDFQKLVKNRNKKPLASSPSTIGGKPTSKATGNNLSHSNFSILMKI